jgi:hypothetical protein
MQYDSRVPPGSITDMKQNDICESHAVIKDNGQLSHQLNAFPHNTSNIKRVVKDSLLGCDVMYVGFESLTVLVMKSSTFWVVTLYSLLKVNRHFRQTCRLNPQGSRISQETA